MVDTALIPNKLLSKGVSVTAWPDSMLKADRRQGILIKESDPGHPGNTRLKLELDDGRVFTNPSFPVLAN